jgi:hypothetical protein
MSVWLQTAMRSVESGSDQETRRALRSAPRPRSRTPRRRIPFFPRRSPRQARPIGILAVFFAPTAGGRQFLAVARDAQRPKQVLKEAARQARSARYDRSSKCPPQNPAIRQKCLEFQRVQGDSVPYSEAFVVGLGRPSTGSEQLFLTPERASVDARRRSRQIVDSSPANRRFRHALKSCILYKI